MPIPTRPVILLVDDQLLNLRVLEDLLSGEYTILTAGDGPTSLERAWGDPAPDLIILDVVMPGMDGYEVCRRLREDSRTQDTPIIFVTSMESADDETRGLTIGATDYLTKPVSPPILKVRVRNCLLLKQARDILTNQNRELEQMVQERTKELALTRDATILSMAALAETRDQETGNHIRRTQMYVRVLAEHLRNHPDFRQMLDDRTIEMLFKSAPLHDIGKIGIPDSILLKPGKLEPEEYAVMKTHTRLGKDAILAAEACLVDLSPDDDTNTSFLSYAREIAYCHHEQWNGNGYPQGLKGDDIPLSARLMAVADVYDALRSARPYKPALSHQQTARMILDSAGHHFDPRVVEAFILQEAEFARIADEYASEVPSSALSPIDEAGR